MKKRFVLCALLILALTLPVMNACAEYFYTTLLPGDKGAAVTDVQKQLIALGYLDGRASGTYNEKTQQAVADFQYYMGLTISDDEVGLATPETQELLFVLPVGTTFMCNVNTGKYHLPGCSTAMRNKPESREYVSSSAMEVEAAGYVPCSKCHPDAVYTAPVYDFSAGSGAAAVPAAGAAGTYVVNVNSGKFHYPDCYLVGNMKPENRMDVECSREELIAQGYDPCGKCHP